MMSWVKRMGWGVMLGCAVTAPTVGADEVSSCFEEGRNTQLCLEMRHMRNLLHAFETQSSLMHVDYRYLSCVAADLDAMVGRALRSATGSSHLRALNDVQTYARLALRRAEAGNLEIFDIANRIGFQCQRCHNEQAPPGRTWPEISRLGWLQITQRCQEAGRNSYVCRQMYGLLAQVQLLESGREVNASRYSTIAAAAGETERIARELLTQGGVHGGVRLPLDELVRAAQDLREAAEAEAPVAVEKASALSVRCHECHVGSEMGGRP